MIDNKPMRQKVVLGVNPRIKILGTVIDVLDMNQTVSLVDEYVRKKVPLHLVGVNADKINEIKRNKRLRQIVNNCGIINADGASVIMASRFLGKPLPERVADIDLMRRITKGLSVCEEKYVGFGVEI